MERDCNHIFEKFDFDFAVGVPRRVACAPKVKMRVL